MIRHTTRLGFAALATLIASLAPDAIAQAAQHCHPAGSHRLTSNSYARVFAKGSNAYVCIKSSGKTTRLKGANPSYEFALGGKWVGWSSDEPSDPSNPGSALPNSVVTVMHIPNHFVNHSWYPFQLNETVDKIVVLSDGAAAWAMTPPPGDPSYTIVQGTDRMNHPADQFSDDHTDLIGSSLHATGPKTVAWRYNDGTRGTQTLY